MKAAIIGVTGYGGAELIRILQRHPYVSIHSVHATNLIGESLKNYYRHMQRFFLMSIEDFIFVIIFM